MNARRKILLSWSGGKDSALAFYELRRSPEYEIVALLTTVASAYRRISHHGVRVELLEEQARAVGIPLRQVPLSHQCSNDEYASRMEEVLLAYKADGIGGVAFGDIFLEDLRVYREQNLRRIGLHGVFPIWYRNTTELMHTFIETGFKAYLSCVDGRKLDASFAGRAIDGSLLADLPADVDPCGENGEFHSFVYDGPIFRRPVGVAVGQIVPRDVRIFADLLPLGADGQPRRDLATPIPPVMETQPAAPCTPQRSETS